MAKYDLGIDVNPGASGVEISIEYARDMFDAATVVRLGTLWRRLLLAAIAAPETAVRALPVLGAAERAEVIEGFNTTAAAYPDGTVLDLFEAQVVRTPQAIAVVDGEDETSYRALASAARRLGRHLIGLGVGAETVVGVCLDRSAGLIEGLLGVFEAGGGYLPLDPDYPAERLGFMLGDAAAPVVLTTRAHAAHARDGAGGPAVPRGGARRGGDRGGDRGATRRADLSIGTARGAGSRQPGLCDLHLRLNRNAQGGDDRTPGTRELCPICRRRLCFRESRSGPASHDHRI